MVALSPLMRCSHLSVYVPAGVDSGSDYSALCPGDEMPSSQKRLSSEFLRCCRSVSTCCSRRTSRSRYSMRRCISCMVCRICTLLLAASSSVGCVSACSSTKPVASRSMTPAGATPSRSSVVAAPRTTATLLDAMLFAPPLVTPAPSRICSASSSAPLCGTMWTLYISPWPAIVPVKRLTLANVPPLTLTLSLSKPMTGSENCATTLTSPLLPTASMSSETVRITAGRAAALSSTSMLSRAQLPGTCVALSAPEASSPTCIHRSLVAPESAARVSGTLK
mmetsp:Transcript_14002/g.35274  ORF Transcript_14002/g.35274 Transcript_14002/m.35274 type:complete len:279 (-) Transcript_14002:862-1698(-)